MCRHAELTPLPACTSRVLCDKSSKNQETLFKNALFSYFVYYYNRLYMNMCLWSIILKIHVTINKKQSDPICQCPDSVSHHHHQIQKSRMNDVYKPTNTPLCKYTCPPIPVYSGGRMVLHGHILSHQLNKSPPLPRVNWNERQFPLAKQCISTGFQCFLQQFFLSVLIQSEANTGIPDRQKVSVYVKDTVMHFDMFYVVIRYTCIT